MRTYNASLEQCLVHVVRARPCVIPNDGFLKQLILYDRFLVERRRKQEVARIQEVNNEASTEIEIQYHSPVVPQRVQPVPPTILTPPKPPTISTYKASSIVINGFIKYGTFVNIECSIINRYQSDKGYTDSNSSRRT